MFAPLFLRPLLGSPMRRAWLSYILGLAVLALCLLLLALTAPASAQDASASIAASTRNFVLEMLVFVFAPAIAALGSAVILRFYALLGVKQTKELQGAVDQILGRSIGFAKIRLGLDPRTEIIPLELEADALEIAAPYAVRSGPATLGKLGIRSEHSAKLHDMLVSRFGDVAPVDAPASASIDPTGR